jgi:Aerotolerance regulator N-terminal
MAFLAPLFLAGLAAVALPILLHLRKNRPKETVAFSSLMFLEASPPVTKRRSRLQDVVLLILRCLALALLILAFARPFFPSKSKPVTANGSVMNFILIDTSASMHGAALDQALLTAGKLVDGFSADDWIAVGTFSDRLRPLLGPERARELTPGERKSAALAALSAVKADWNATHLDASLLAAVADDVPMIIHVIGDFQKGATLDRLRGEAWPDQLQIIPHPITFAKGWTNAGARILPAEKQIPRVRVTNAEGSAKSDFTLDWSGQKLTVSVPPGDSATFDAPSGMPADGKVKLTGDDFTFDNEAAWTTPVRPIARIWYPGQTDIADASEGLYFLSRALQSTPDYEVEIRAEIPKEAPSLTIADGRLDDPAITAMQGFLKSGGNALFTVRDAGSAAAIAKILGAKAGTASEAKVDDHARLGEIDFNSSVFAPFADARYSDFSGIRFWKYRVLASDLVARGSVLARFDSGDPEWITFSIGKGTLHVLTTTWRPADSQLALTTKFAPLLHSLLAVPTNRRAPLLIGESFAAPSRVTKPDGAKVDVQPGVPFTATDAPGIYRGENFAFAVQIDPSESELTPLPESELRSLGLPLDPPKFTAQTAEVRAEISNLEQERRQRFGWWALVAAAGFFLAETAWAALASNRLTPATP